MVEVDWRRQQEVHALLKTGRFQGEPRDSGDDTAMSLTPLPEPGVGGGGEGCKKPLCSLSSSRVGRYWVGYVLYNTFLSEK